MLTAEIRIVIPGRPAPKGSLKCVGGRGGRHQLVDQLKTTKPWQDHVAASIRREWPADQHAYKHQPVGVRVTVTVPRPATHYGTGANAGVVKDRWLDAYPVEQGHGDTDKHLRALLDAVQATDVLPDDAQVIDTHARKRFVLPHLPGALAADDVMPVPGVVLRLYPL